MPANAANGTELIKNEILKNVMIKINAIVVFMTFIF